MAVLGVNTFIGVPYESPLTVKKDVVCHPLPQAPVPALSGLSKEAQEQQRNDEGGLVKSESGSDWHDYKGK